MKKLISDEILKWFTDNYIQTKNECIVILLQAQKDYPFTIEQIQDGCIALRKLDFDKNHLPTHIKILDEMCNRGIKASIAGEKLRKTILKIEEYVRRKP